MQTELKEKKAQTAMLARLQKWCGLRDRSEREARFKADELMVKMAPWLPQQRREAIVEMTMATLKQGAFLDDTRCAESYTHAHFEHKGWGPLKVKAGLIARGISGRAADEAIRVILDDAWQDKAELLLRRRQSELQDHRDRLVRWLMQRGFPQHMVWSVLDRVESELGGEAVES
ncbi:MAG: regulatory protein RecX [Bacteroidota bacterium]|nr:regulatory protein RecX [Bacteroidota bacterium]